MPKLKKRKRGRPKMAPGTRKAEGLAFRITYYEKEEFDTARSILDESKSDFCKLALKARIKWVLKNHTPGT